MKRLFLLLNFALMLAGAKSAMASTHELDAFLGSYNPVQHACGQMRILKQDNDYLIETNQCRPGHAISRGIFRLERSTPGDGMLVYEVVETIRDPGEHEGAAMYILGMFVQIFQNGSEKYLGFAGNPMLFRLEESRD